MRSLLCIQLPKHWATSFLVLSTKETHLKSACSEAVGATGPSHRPGSTQRLDSTLAKQAFYANDISKPVIDWAGKDVTMTNQIHLRSKVAKLLTPLPTLFSLCDNYQAWRMSDCYKALPRPVTDYETLHLEVGVIGTMKKVPLPGTSQFVVHDKPKSVPIMTSVHSL